MHSLDLSGKTSYVYFLKIGENGPIKIGFTKHIRHRLTIIQVDNPLMVILIAVLEGGRKEEFALHKKFAKYRLYGEWFTPDNELIDFISTLHPLNLVTADFQKKIKRGIESHNWKGDAVCAASKNQRARAYTRYKKKCDRCKLGKGLDSVYKDGNKNNLDPDNIVLYCRRCRMELDGTLDIIKNVKHEKKSLRPCKICGKMGNRFWYDRCHTCSEFFRRHGFERSEKRVGPKDPVKCIVCERLVKEPAKGKCHTCYEFFRRNGFERTKFKVKKINSLLEKSE